MSHLFAFCDHHHPSEGNLTLRRIKCDTARFGCVCDCSVVVCGVVIPQIR